MNFNRDKFPKEYRNLVPDSAEKKSIKAYRLCRTGKCDKDSFLSWIDEKRKFEDNFTYRKKLEPTHFSVSLFSDMEDLEEIIEKTPYKFAKHPYEVAVGFTNTIYGVIKLSSKNSHIDWWLYLNSKPYKNFNIIEGFMDKFRELVNEGDNNE